MSCIKRLPDTSMTHALMRESPESFGWGQDRYLLADIFDAVNQNTRASGNWGKNGAPKIDSYPRPSIKRKSEKVAEKKRRTTVADLFKRFQHHNTQESADAGR